MLSIEQVIRLGARRFLYTGTKTIPALAQAGSAILQIQIQNDAHFLSEFFTVTYPTVDGEADDGVTRLSVSLMDGTQLKLTSDFVDLATIATPGRQRSAGIAGDPSLPLHIQGLPFLHVWESTSQILMDMRNTADTAASVSWTWSGYKIPLDKLSELRNMFVPYNFQAIAAAQAAAAGR